MPKYDNSDTQFEQATEYEPMITFTQSCFVRVKDVEKRKELIRWLRGIGRKVFGCSESRWIVAGDGEGNCVCTELEGNAVEVFGKSAVDCGEDVDMFKCLAAQKEEVL